MKTYITYIAMAILFIVSISAVAVRTSYLYHVPKAQGLKKDTQAMDRYSLSDTLIYIFGPESRDIVRENIFDIGAPIGGSCDFYKMNYDEEQKIVDPFTRCSAMIKDINSPMFVKINPLRTAAVGKACRILTLRSDLLEHALEVSEIPKGQPVALAEVEKLYFTFHKAPMGESDAEVYRDAIDKAKTPLTWIKVAYAMCISPSWQIL
jgi:hypothetical protein